ncbi:response regulator transcription factor [Bradyrhizobium genosp. L]|uniref:LuxR C-terminal-related transcriptional regulator n=1 Tax=Bradyrhizobium genosp. L TaxID=83637 RepID=UPI0018A2EBA0|nr:response regulator transcription factor [Bradyrhizobium genosp. L]QPF85235.1 response regulator transcription factor [Bradyrhizobium genosp. L]
MTTTAPPAEPPPVSKADAPRLLIVEDHPLFRAALIGVIGAEFPDAEVLQATSIDGALDIVAAREDFDLILLDLSMPGTSGLLGAYRVRAAAPRSALVIVSAHDDSRIVGSAIALGIFGYIPKSTPKAELARLLRGILDGDVSLPKRFRDAAAARRGQADTSGLLQHLGQMTAQQLRVLDMICHGLQNKHIAYELDISVTTVKVHVSEILRKLGVRSRTEAIIALSKLDFGKHDHAPVTAASASEGEDS